MAHSTDMLWCMVYLVAGARLLNVNVKRLGGDDDDDVDETRISSEVCCC